MATRLVFCLLSLLLLIGCAEDAPIGSFEILPRPQEFTISGSSKLPASTRDYYAPPNSKDDILAGYGWKKVEKSEASIIVEIAPDSDLHPEGYTMHIGEKIRIKSKTESGMLYAFMTLNQLQEDATEQLVTLPLSEIKDFPVLNYRAIHIDVKHHLEKESYYYQLIDRMVALKINAAIVEIEDKLQYVRQPLVGSADAMTIEQWRAISAYAYARNISLSPLVQGLGHASFILKHNQYKPLRDDPESDWAFDPLNPETYAVQYDLYLDAMDAFPHGKYLHIGGDEVHTTGRNSKKSAMELQLEWLNKVCSFAADNNRVPIFWDDMPLKQAGVYNPMYDPDMEKTEVDSIWEVNGPNLEKFIDQFPNNCVYMRWNYWHPDAYGNLKAMDWFREHDFKVMGATAGQTRWVLMPQNQSNIPNIRSFALSSAARNLDGLLLTLWDDDSPHFELYMRGIFAFAEYTWAGEGRSIKEVKKLFRRRAFGLKAEHSSYAFIDTLEHPVAAWQNLLVSKGQHRNRLSFRSDLEGVIDLPDPDNPGAWSSSYSDRIEAARTNLEITQQVSEQLRGIRQIATRNLYTLEVYEQVNDLVKFSNELLLILHQLDQPSEVINRDEIYRSLIAMEKRFGELRNSLQQTYAHTRILSKPDDYLLDQDHHRHTANQSLNFDWQFVAEIQLLTKIDEQLVRNATLEQ